jgi:hypothetical protein
MYLPNIRGTNMPSAASVPPVMVCIITKNIVPDPDKIEI